MGAIESANRDRSTETWLTRPRRGTSAAELRRRYVTGLFALVALYYAAAQLGYALKFSGPVAAIVWLPVGVGIAFLYLAGLKFWPGVVIGDLLVNNYTALPFGAALGQTFGNLLEVVVATVLLHRLVRRGAPLGTVGDVGRTFVALAVGTAVSATIGSLSLLLGGVVAAKAFAEVWRTWWLGDLSGALLVVPLVLAWMRPVDNGLLRRRRLELVAALLTVADLSALALVNTKLVASQDQLFSARMLLLLAFPALIWSAVRLRERGATLGVALAAAAVVWATTHFVGPFPSHSLTRSVLEAQLYIVIAALTTLCLAAAVTEREALARWLSVSRRRLIQAADAERLRIEHNLHDGAQQLLTGVTVRLGLAAEQIEQSPARAEALIRAAQSELGHAIDELRELAHGNHPAVLIKQGLAGAMERIAEHSIVRIELVELPSTRLDPTVEANAYYVLAEAITNAQRYARAAVIRVRALVSRGELHLEVADDGAGGAVETPGSGLEGLRDRVEAVGGEFDVASVPGQGTRVTAAIPLTRPTR